MTTDTGAVASREGLLSKLKAIKASTAIEAADALTDTLALCREAAGEIEALSKKVYQPGVFKCAKCNFELVQKTLNTNTGSVTARDAVGEKCPNDGSPMWRVSYMEDNAKAWEWGEGQFDRAVKAEAERDAALTIIGNLFARIFRDGGHAQDALGLDLAAIEADKVVVELLQAADERDAALARVAVLEDALRSAHLPAETSKGYPTFESEAVKRFCQAAIAEDKPGDGWRPIDSAPRDGTVIDVWIGERRTNVRWVKARSGWWRVNPDGSLNEYGERELTPTHWRPLPSPPGKVEG